MRFIYIFLIIFIFSNNLLSNNLFDTEEYQIKFVSEDINLLKEKKINDIKIKSFKSIITKILTEQNLKKLDISNIEFVNKFVLNFTINEEKIVNDTYFSKVKVNFNKNLIFDYLINNNLQFVDRIPKKFLIIIFEQKEFENYFLSNENTFYNYLNNSNNELFKKYFLIPDLDFNDRYIFNEYHLKNNIIKQHNLLNHKYQTEYQILINSYKKNNLFIYDLYLFFKNKKYYIGKIPYNNLNYEELFKHVLSKSINKWKELNLIDPTITNSIECNISINNIYELSHVRSLLKSNRIIKYINLKSIKLNYNLYTILFFGNLDVFKNSLKNNRLYLENLNNDCNIKLL